jgi:rhodanese-related sulfurtransferase
VITRRMLAVSALVLGATALAIGNPVRSGRSAEHISDATRLAQQIEREEDHVTARELATWIQERRALHILDFRTRREFDESHLPGARHSTIEAAMATHFQASDTIVLYSAGGAHAAQAWVLLRAAGHERVYFLKGGLQEWTDYFGTPQMRDPERGGC